MSSPLVRHAAATVHGRYLVQPARSAGAARWLVGFHGYGQSAAPFLPGLAAAARSGEWLVASVQALHPFYTRADEVVANWMTREDRELAIPDNIGYVDAVCDALEGEFGPPRTLVFAGFSQGVAMAWRAALMGRRRATALFSVGGDLPPGLRSGGRRPWPRLALLTGEQDEWYTPSRLASDAALLRGAGAEPRPHVFAGGHEWGEPVIGALAGLLAELERD